MSSSNFSRIARNPETDRPIATAAALIFRRQTVLRAADHLSHAGLAVIPRRRAGTDKVETLDLSPNF